MRIFEVKNNLVKIFYETSDNLFLSGFVMIKDSRESYIGQIMHMESSKHGNVAIAKIIFNITPDGIITSYSGTIPAINSAISNINSNDFLKLIQGQTPILIGEFIENDLLVSLDKSLLENKLVICSESQENSDLIIKTLDRQIRNYGKKTIIIDTDGESIFGTNNFVLGENFHLPINNQLINFIYEKGLDFKSARSKAILQETFLDIQYYLSSLEEPYIPVNKFIDILEKQYEKSKLPELVLLKNALIKFDQAGIFANNILEYKELFDSLLNNQITSVDISNVDETIQREAISYVYNLVQELSDEYYIFIKTNNENSDKKLLKQIFSNKKAFTIITCSYTYKYLTELKKIAKNLILFTPLLQQQDFASYNTLLSTLGRSEFVVYGQATQFMPLIIKLSDRVKIMSAPPQTVLTPEDTQKIIQKQLREQQEKQESEKLQKEAFTQQQQMSQQMLQQQMSQMIYPQVMPYQQNPQVFYPQQQPIFQQPQMFAPNPYMNMVNPYVQNPYVQNQPYVQVPFVNPMMPQTNPITPVQNSALQQQMPQQMQQPAQPQQTQSFQQSQTNIAPQESKTEEKQIFKAIEPQEMPIENNFEEQNQNNQVENSGIIDTSQFEQTNQLTEEDLDTIQDVDLYENEQQTPEIIEEVPQENIQEDDSYLDEIQPDENDIENNVQEIAEEQETDFKTQYNITEESLKEPETVPVYPANTGSNTNINFEKGDVVIHHQFGNGRIEKIINYGNKKLCSVYFEGVGRRLLDPTLSEIKKVD